MTRSTYPQPSSHQDMSIPRAQRAAAANRAWLAKRNAERAALTGDEYRLWAVVRMWGSMTLETGDARIDLANSLVAKGRIVVTWADGCAIVRLPK